jgi:UrcA family protein
MKNPYFIGLTAALITAGAIKATPAFSQPPAAQADTYVSYVHTSDLDLSSESGRRALEKRLARAAREVCGTASDVDLQGKNAVRDCRDEAIARATGQRDAILAGAAERGAVIAVTAAR